MDVTYEWSEVGTRILHHHVHHELRSGLLAKIFLLLSFNREQPLRCHSNKQTYVTLDVQAYAFIQNLQLLLL